MKKLLHTLLLFAVGLFAACQAPTSGGDVYLNDFLDDLTAQTDAGPAIRAALSHCAGSGPHGLFFRVENSGYDPIWRSKSTSSSATTTKV